MAFGIEQEEQGAVRILALSGRLDTETSADLELALQDLQAAGATHFLIDLAEIGYVSSAGLRVLLALAKQLDGGRGSLRLCELNAAVTQVFDVAGFSKLFSIYPTRAAALAGHVEATPDPSLARRVASLIGAPETDSAGVNPKSAELARAAAQLLAAEKAGNAAKPAVEPAKSKPPSAAQPKPASTPVQAPQAAPAGEAPGVLGKLKNLFGGKR